VDPKVGRGDGVKLGGKVVREDGNEGKQAEMSTHTYHTHIHTLKSGNLLAQLSCPDSVPSLFVPYLGASVWERKTPCPPPPRLAVTLGRSHLLASISPPVWRWSDNTALLPCPN